MRWRLVWLLLLLALVSYTAAEYLRVRSQQGVRARIAVQPATPWRSVLVDVATRFSLADADQLRLLSENGIECTSVSQALRAGLWCCVWCVHVAVCCLCVQCALLLSGAGVTTACAPHRYHSQLVAAGELQVVGTVTNSAATVASATSPDAGSTPGAGSTAAASSSAAGSDPGRIAHCQQTLESGVQRLRAKQLLAAARTFTDALPVCTEATIQLSRLLALTYGRMGEVFKSRRDYSQVLSACVVWSSGVAWSAAQCSAIQ